MKRWAIVTVGMYALIFAALSVPVAFLAFARWWGADTGPDPSEVLDMVWWFFVPIMALGAALLLFIPLHVAERRLPSRRKLIVPVIATAFFLMSLVFMGGMSLLAAILGDRAFEVFEIYNNLAGVPDDHPAAGRNSMLTLILMVASLWIFWGVLFYRSSKADSGEALTRRATRWLLRGSILELLVAVPSHVIVRHRHDCCAPIASFWGITTGIAVMLACFGPGVFFLFVERMRRLRPKPPEPPDSAKPAPQAV